MVFPQAHRQARQVQIVEQRSLPQTAQKYLQRVRSFPIQMTFSYDDAVLTATCEEGGVRYKERIFALVEDWGQLGADKSPSGPSRKCSASSARSSPTDSAPTPKSRTTCS